MSAEISFDISESGNAREACENRLADLTYFIVGLSDGVTEENGPMTPPMDILRYVEAVDGIVLFDGPELKYIGTTGTLPPPDFEGWGQACTEMGTRIQGIATALKKPDGFFITRASQVCAIDPQGYQRIFQEIQQQAQANSWIAEKLWKIVPPYQKKSHGFEVGVDFATLDPAARGHAFQLMSYEIAHLAFILFSQGAKIRHGWGERKSSQVIQRLRGNYPDWKGEVIDPPPLRAQRIQGRYPLPYRLWPCQQDARQLLGKAVLEDGQIPLRSTLHLGEAMRQLVDQGKTEELRAYFSCNIPDPDLRAKVLELDFTDPRNLYWAAASLSSSMLWPIEKEILTILRASNRERWKQYLSMKALDVFSDLCLSPDLEVILTQLLPRFCGDWDAQGETASSLQFLLEHGEGPLSCLPDGEQKIMRSVFNVLRELFEVAVGDSDTLKSSTWFNCVLEIDKIFGDRRFFNTLGQGHVYDDPEAREVAVQGLLEAKSGLELADAVSSSHMMRLWGGTCVDLRGGMSLTTRAYVLSRIMIPYLIAQNHPHAILWQNLFCEESQNAFVFMWWDNISKAYSEARSRDLGLDIGEEIEADRVAAERMRLVDQMPQMKEIFSCMKDIWDFLHPATDKYESAA